MSSLENAGLTGPQRARVEAALAFDPDLAVELDAIVGQLSGRARRRFWSAFADQSARRKRPAAAVLAALERATLGD